MLFLVILSHLLVFASPKEISIGKFQEYAHGLKGEVVLLNERQYMIKKFHYDGKGPAVWHIGMKSGSVGIYSENAYAFQNENCNCDRLTKGESNGEVTITIPKKLSLSKDIESIAVYCYQFCHNFGHVKIPKGLKLDPAPENLTDYDDCKPEHPLCSIEKTGDNGVCKDPSGKEQTCPIEKPMPTKKPTVKPKPIKIGKFTQYAHGLKGEVYILNERQYMIKKFYYDGKGPAVWHTGMPPGTAGVYSEKGYAFQNEKKNCKKLGKSYKNRKVTITIPKNLRLSQDIATIAVYCYEFCHNFGHVKIPKGLKIPAAPDNLPDYELCKPEYPLCTKEKTGDNGVCTHPSSGIEETCPITTKCFNKDEDKKKTKSCPWASPPKPTMKMKSGM